MVIVHHAHLPTRHSDGAARVVAADATLGVRTFEVCVHRLEPGARSTEAWHGYEHVVLALAGRGKLLLNGAPQRFAAPCTVLLPPHRRFQFVNDGAETLQLVAVQACPPRHGPSPTEPLALSGDAAAADGGNTAVHAERKGHEPTDNTTSQGAEP